MKQPHRRVVITGLGLTSPIGNSLDELWASLREGRSGVDYLQRIPGDHLPTSIGAEASEFAGEIDDFGPLEKNVKRSIKKGLKLMCREIRMGVAAAQKAIADAGLGPDVHDPDRIGTMFGSDYIITEPSEFSSGIQKCITGDKFDFDVWGEQGLPQVEPLWLLKYLPNMPASHVAIYNDLRGPSNSLTVREASANLAIAEATTIIRRGIADTMVVGSTGSRIHPLRTVHVALQEQLAPCELNGDPAAPMKASRPFEASRSGMVMGEGAGCVILEDLDSANAREARILGEVIGYGSSTVADRKYIADYGTALANSISAALQSANISADAIDHVNSHGLGALRCDREEAHAIANTISSEVPVVAVKSNMGNLGAGSGMVELIASVIAVNENRLFPTLNYDSPDRDCPINVVVDGETTAGSTFVNLNVTPQGQASAVIVRSFA